MEPCSKQTCMDSASLLFLLSTNCESDPMRGSVRVTLLQTAELLQLLQSQPCRRLTTDKEIILWMLHISSDYALLFKHTSLFCPLFIPLSFFLPNLSTYTLILIHSRCQPLLFPLSPFTPTPHLHLTASLPSYHSPPSPPFFCQLRHTSCTL